MMGNLHVGYSKISQDLFNDILSLYQKTEHDYIFFASKNKEFSIKEDKLLIYDFCDLKNRKIIEFNGDIFHGNPKLFKESDTPNPFKKNKTAKDLWSFDEEKKNIAIKNGFSIIIIWELDYRKNKGAVIDKCKEFLCI